MNGYTPSLDVVTRIYNLIEQIPAEYLKAAESECFSIGMSDHEYERNLTGYVMRKGWITDEQNAQAAEIANDDKWTGSAFEALDTIGMFQDGRNEVENAQIIAYFGRSNVTTSAEWRKRHLHQTK